MASVKTLVGTTSGGISTSGESSGSAAFNASIPVEQQNILLDSTNNYYQLENNNSYYDIYNIFYDFSIVPSIILPELTEDATPPPNPMSIPGPPKIISLAPLGILFLLTYSKRILPYPPVIIIGL